MLALVFSVFGCVVIFGMVIAIAVHYFGALYDASREARKAAAAKATLKNDGR